MRDSFTFLDVLNCLRKFLSHLQTGFEIVSSLYTYRLSSPLSLLSWTSSLEVVGEVLPTP